VERNDVKKLLVAVSAYFPNFNPPNKEEVAAAWYDILKDYDGKEIALSLKAYVTQDHEFAPKVGQLIAGLNKMHEDSYPSDLEAWGMVRKAISNGGYHALEEFNKLPEIIQKAVGSEEVIRGMAIDENYSETVAQSNFLRNYRMTVEREKERKQMIPEVRAYIDSLQGIGIEEKG